MTSILFTASRMSHIEQFHLPYIEYYAAHGFCVHTAAQGEAAQKLNAVHHALPFYKKRPWKNLATVLRLRKIIKREKIDIVISNATLAGLVTRAAVLFVRRRPTVIHSCQGYLFGESGARGAKARLKRLAYIAAEKFFAPVTKLVVTMNAEDFEAAKRHRLGRDVKNISGIGIKPRAAEAFGGAEISSIKSNFGISADVILLYAAEFSARKNQKRLVELFAPLFGEEPPALQVVLAGDGATRNEVAAQVAAQNLDGRILLPGFVSPVSQLLACADIAVSASKSEGLPFNIMEAMQAGVPVLASRVKGHTDLIEDGENGFLFSLDDEREFEQKLRLLCQDEALRRKFAENSRARIKAFELPAVFDTIIQTYSFADERLLSK